MTKKTEDDFYDDFSLVNDEDIAKAKKNKTTKPLKLSSSKQRNNYEKVSANKEIDKEEILQGEPMIEKQSEEFLVEYEILDEPKETKESSKAKLPYIGFAPRLIASIVLVPILSLLSIYLLYHAYVVDDLVNIRYTELGVITPKNVNEETIDLDIEYQFKVNELSNLSLNYQTQAELVIVDKENEEKVYYQETIPLMEEQDNMIMQGDTDNFHDNFTINKKELEEKVKKYQESYPVETTSYINVSFIIGHHSISKNSYYLSDTSNMSAQIPLLSSDKELEINNLDIEKRVNTRPTIRVKSVGLLGLGILVSIGAVLSLTWALILIYSTIDQKSLYDKTVGKILKKYKKMIQEVPKVPRKTKKQIHTMNSMKELVKLSKKWKQPIKYCVIHERSKCQFFIEYNKELFTYIIKEVDLENKD